MKLGVMIADLNFVAFVNILFTYKVKGTLEQSDVILVNIC